MPNQFQPLRFATAERVQRLTEPQIPKSDFAQNVERFRQRLRFADLGEELDRLAHGELKHVVNRFPVQLDFQHVRLEPFAFAFGAAHVKIAQELHLDLLEPGP